VPPDALRIVHNLPLEREYEAWIVWGIENYLQSIGRAYAIHAVTPGVERSWPADESLSFSGKLVGLQMKQAHLAPTKSNQTEAAYDRLKWTFAQPRGQYQLVQQRREIFYCLPTFTNREYRREALHHSLFWRPDGSTTDYNAWYDNGGGRVQTPHKSLHGATRWGLFYENLIRCEAGIPVSSKGDIDRFLTDIASFVESREIPSVEDVKDSQSSAKPEGNGGGFYIVAIEL